MVDTWRPAEPGDASWDNRLLKQPNYRVTWGKRPHDPEFKPDFSPMQMELMGVFGKAYWGPAGGAERRLLIPEQVRPPETSYNNIRGRQCREVNYFKTKASLDIDWWLNKGLIYDFDPLGWYEWYWWYCMGRRIVPYDQWQINRWIQFRARHLNHSPTPGRSQALLHWGVRAPSMV